MNATQRKAFHVRERAVIRTFNRAIPTEIGIRAMRAMIAESAAWQDSVDLPEILRERVHGSYAHDATHG